MLTIQKLEHEEYGAYTLLKEKYPDLTENFLRKVPIARFKIMERLTNALLRENIIHKKVLEERENLIKIRILDSTLLIPITRKDSYNRYELVNNVRFSDEQGNESKLIHPLDLLQVLIKKAKEQGLTYNNIDDFQKEIANSVANMALALVFEDRRNLFYRNMCQEKNWTSTFELVNELAKEDDSFDKILFFEQLCVTGHHQHPCTKSKIGLSPENVILYSPEFGETVSLVFVALRRDIVFYRLENESKQLNHIWDNDYPELHNLFYASCLKKGKEIDDYILLPVHPWQWENVITKMYSEEIEQGRILYIESFTLPSRPTLSVRTLSPIGREKKYHLKLPLNVQMTSAVRLISPNAIQNGPELTQLLRHILKVEKNFDGKLDILWESIGIRFKSMDLNDKKNENLSVLLRDNPLALLYDGETAVVACALLNSTVVSNQLLLFEIIESYNIQNKCNLLKDNVLLFFRRYVDILLNGIIPLMTRYGIGLEGHLQNSLIVFKENEPSRIIVRDLGGIRVDVRRLEKQGYFGEFHPDSAIIGSDYKEMHNKIIHTVFQNHIGELTLHISKHFKIDESLLWNVVRDVCYKVFAKLNVDCCLKDQVDLDMAAIFAPFVETKALTVMRLYNDVTNYTYTRIPNPLFNKSIHIKGDVPIKT